MRWVIQSNLTNVEDCNKIHEICVNHSYPCESLIVVPFSTELPSIDSNQPTVFYGATNFINNIHKSKRWNPGTFFDPETFTVKAYVRYYKERMFNYPCTFTTIENFAASHQAHDKLFFLRPIKDLKEFSGEVMEFNKIVSWERKLRYLPGVENNPDLSLNTEIAVSEPYNLAHEWRVFVVDGKVVSGSHYRSYLRLDQKPDLPTKVIEFVEDSCKVWVPAKVFVMDVGESSKNLFIIECNCFNSSGFYKSDVEKIVISVSELL